ncbi:MAG: hypothetical protein DRI65_13990 [Chloroflexota bacterium]|nr:MAG: hypothetical protein DRI65_13990 [Chloroflexota bacterium]
MNKYGQAAVQAARMLSIGSVSFPQDAWERATSEIFGKGTPSQKKGCPKGAFLGLCEEGYVKGVPPGNYTNSTKNKRYAIQAVNLLRKDPTLSNDPKSLWALVMQGEPKSHNSQMDVVVSLWMEGYLESS